MYGEQMGMMGFPAGTNFIPYAVLRNVTNEPLHVNATVLPAEGDVDSEEQLGQFTLGTLETRPLDASKLVMSALGDYMGTINLTFRFNGNSGDLLLATGSVDETGNYVFEVEPQSVRASQSRDVNYWSVRDGNDSMVTLWNPTRSPEKLKATFYFENARGGTANYVLALNLGPLGAANISVTELIRSGQPDALGHTIPRSVMEGSLAVSGPSVARREQPAEVAGGGPDAGQGRVAVGDKKKRLELADDGITHGTRIIVGLDAECFSSNSCPIRS